MLSSSEIKDIVARHSEYAGLVQTYMYSTRLLERAAQIAMREYRKRHPECYDVPLKYWLQNND